MGKWLTTRVRDRKGDEQKQALPRSGDPSLRVLANPRSNPMKHPLAKRVGHGKRYGGTMQIPDWRPRRRRVRV